MRCSILVYIFAICFSSNLYAQNFKFEYSEDSTVLGNRLQQLAKDLTKLKYDETKIEDLNNLFRIQVVSKDYESSIRSLRLLRNLYEEDYGEFSKVVKIEYEAYCITEIKEQNSRDKDILFDRILDSIYVNVSESAKEYSFYYLNIDLKNISKDFNETIAKTKEKDSMSKQDAIKLCRDYASYILAQSIAEKGKTYINKERDKKYIISDSLFITTRDKARLSAIVVRKRKDTIPLPVILKFDIYPSKDDIREVKLPSNYGYVGMTVNTRGKRYSPDKMVSFEKDGEDLYDVIDWISKQPWCNGEVAMYGGSYLGFAQWASTKNLHPALKTIVPMVSVGPGIDYPMYNNVFMSYMLRWIHNVENNKYTDDDEFYNTEKWDSLYFNWYKKGTAFSTLDSLDGRPSTTFQKWLEHPSYDEYWQNMMPYKEDFSKINIPILTFTGYYDSDQVGALHYYKEHVKYRPNSNHYLVIGPYDHGGAAMFPSETLRGYTIDSIANIRQIPMTYKWFNYILRDSIKPNFLKGKVNYQVMGTNQWKSKETLKDIANDTLIFYLDATISNNHFKLNKEKSKDSNYILEEVDFLDRSSFKKFQKFPLKILDNVFTPKSQTTFISNKFEEDFEINGSFTGNIDLAINKKDLDISIELYEFTKDNEYFALSTYLGRASYAKNKSKRNLLKPNKKESIPIKNSSFTSKLIKKGSRLLVVLSVNKNPYWQINYGTGKDVSSETIKDGNIPLKIKWMNSSTIKVPIYRYK